MSNERLTSTLSGPVGKVAAALAAYEGLKQVTGTLTALYQNHLELSVTVRGQDVIYSEVLDWVTTVVPSNRQQSLIAGFGTRGGRSIFDEDTEEGRTPKRAMKVAFNDSTKRSFVLDGHKIKVQITRPEVDQAKGHAQEQICFTMATRNAREALVKHLSKLAEKTQEREPVLRIVNQWSNWESRFDLPLRSLNSVILPEDQKNTIVEDLTGFLESESRYVDLALPWHRGYLFHGPPGTGKTSLVKALANEFKLDLWYISLNDLKEDASLISLLGEVRPRSILLIEDVDTLSITKSRTAPESVDSGNGKQISLSSLLNALDGVATPHGLITMMTTNHYDQLDDALVRAGRMDRIEHLGYPTMLEVEKLYKRFYGIELGIPMELLNKPVNLSPAELSETLKRYLNDPVGAATALYTILDGMSLDA